MKSNLFKHIFQLISDNIDLPIDQQIRFANTLDAMIKGQVYVNKIGSKIVFCFHAEFPTEQSFTYGEDLAMLPTILKLLVDQLEQQGKGEEELCEQTLELPVWELSGKDCLLA